MRVRAALSASFRSRCDRSDLRTPSNRACSALRALPLCGLPRLRCGNLLGVAVPSRSMLAFNFCSSRHAHLSARGLENGYAIRVPRHGGLRQRACSRVRGAAGRSEKLARDASEAVALRKSDAARPRSSFRQPRPAIADHRDHDGERRARELERSAVADEREELYSAIGLGATTESVCLEHADVSRIERGAARPAPELDVTGSSLGLSRRSARRTAASTRTTGRLASRAR